jgi:hypothetical protein
VSVISPRLQHAHGVHQHGEEVVAGEGGVAQAGQGAGALVGVAAWKSAQAAELALLLLVGGALQLDGRLGLVLGRPGAGRC